MNIFTLITVALCHFDVARDGDNKDQNEALPI